MSHSAIGQDLRQLRIQSKELLRAVRAGESDALARVLPYFAPSQPLTLAGAQLVIARENGHESWARLKRALEPNSEPTGPTLSEELFLAIENGDEERAIGLITQFPSLAGVWRRKSFGGWENALNAAAQHGRLATTRALVEAGAAIYHVNQGDYPPVFNAVRAKHKDVADYLLASSIERDGGLPPTYGVGIDIVLASRLGMLERVKMHVERDPMAVFRRGCIGESVLHWPAHNGHVEVVEYLVDNGAMIHADEIGLYGGKPIHWAAEHSPNTLKLLLQRGADPNSRNVMQNDFQGYTPLHMWARQREECIECAQILLEAAADPTLVDAQGMTPVQIAKLNDRHQSAAFLEAL